MKLKIATTLIIIIFSGNLEATTYDVERSKYTKALKNFKNKNYQKFIDLKEQLKEYPLYANLEYKNLPVNGNPMKRWSLVVLDQSFGISI